MKETPMTIQEWIDWSIPMFGKNSMAVKFLQDQSKALDKGTAEKIVVPREQFITTLSNLHQGGLKK